MEENKQEGEKGMKCWSQKTREHKTWECEKVRKRKGEKARK